jgi:hypothetical protein
VDARGSQIRKGSKASKHLPADNGILFNTPRSADQVSELI